MLGSWICSCARTTLLLLRFTRAWGTFHAYPVFLCTIHRDGYLTTICSYSVFRRVRDYYSDGTDALDMRKALPRDKKRQTIRENGDSYIVEPQDVW